ncbi:hypothetical protein K469DRAFT_725309 [Zopfia rhizophila CBS 207.26]|uniref:HTH CENPB-type domain-containing protein n=1 Tax=Zopfia rhizophila CBS 207.26 TaxID=1314779 RepID=A0A6A6E5Y1_9PEZI|nr:hypothetical protein K469DRAFT_725309 [Zopfia rhizophila CBS 207.26]
MDPASAVLSEGLNPSMPTTYAALSESSNVPTSTLWHRAHGRLSKEDKAIRQQYLTPSEETALVEYLLRMSNNGFPVPIKYLRSLALIIARQRCSVFQAPTTDGTIRPPSKNWPQGFYKRHPKLKAKRELHDPVILPENVYNMDETGVMLSMLSSLKVLVSKDDLRTYRGGGVKRTTVTAIIQSFNSIECISADGRSLYPLIIWPATTHRNTWTTYPTPGWHFACSQSGYTDSKISLD